MSAVVTEMGLIWIVECGGFYTLLFSTVSASIDSVKTMYQLKKHNVELVSFLSLIPDQTEHSLINLFILIEMKKIKWSFIQKYVVMQISFIKFNQRFLQCIRWFDSDYVSYIKCTIPILFSPNATPVCVQQWMQLCVTSFECNCGKCNDDCCSI